MLMLTTVKNPSPRFSDKSERVENKIAKQTGLDMSQVMGILAQFAPFIGLLGQRKEAEKYRL